MTLPNGTRVQIHPACDAWMQGDKYGEIVGRGITRDYTHHQSHKVVQARPYRVKLDKSGRVLRFHPDNVSAID